MQRKGKFKLNLEETMLTLFMQEDMVENEVKILRRLDHPNIIKLIAEQDTKPMLYLVVEYVRGGDLFDAITVAQKFSEDQAALMISHLVSALAYLHNLNVVHRDVKPENLLVSFLICLLTFKTDFLIFFLPFLLKLTLGIYRVNCCFLQNLNEILL